VIDGPRRDFLLDSGGVSALAANRDLLVAYIDLLKQRFDRALLIPIPVLTEVRSGQRRSDALVDRLIKAVGAENDIYAPLTVGVATRAGVPRTEALSLSRHDISTTDAQVVAMAEERSRICAVTIITGDPEDINLLVGLTRRPNIAVDVPADSGMSPQGSYKRQTPLSHQSITFTGAKPRTTRNRCQREARASD
jgi:hypothetical protein